MKQQSIHPSRTQRPARKYLTLCTLCSLSLLFTLLLTACGGNPQLQQQADKNKMSLDTALAQAKTIGVPSTLLAPIQQQEVDLVQTSAPMSPFSDQNTNTYYTNLATRYRMLTTQVRGLITQSTQNFDYQATLDLQSLEGILAQRQQQGFKEAKIFADQLTQYQKQMAQAQYPKDYIQISQQARNSATALHLMGSTYDNLSTLRLTIQQLQASHLDVTALTQQEQNDLQLFRSATTPTNFLQLNDQITVQLQETMTFSAQAIPYVGAAKLKQFQSNIALLKQYGQDTTTFQKHLASDQTALDEAKTLGDFLKVSSQIDADVNAIQTPLVQGQATYMVKQFHQEVTSWGKAHTYHDRLDGNNYALDYEYDQQGIGSDLDIALQTAQTVDDYQAVVDLANNDMVNLKAMEADYSDKTPWNQSHATDMQLLKTYNAMTGQVIVVSFIEQSLRLYQDGKVVKSYLITSGQFDKPSVPGFWHIFLRQSPTKFKSSEPKGSAFWYPDTKINFAMEYHDGGYFFHDSWWRADYGPGTNFPHYDSGGNESFAGNGSHGCINMQEDQANWLYNNTAYGTAVIIY